MKKIKLHKVEKNIDRKSLYEYAFKKKAEFEKNDFMKNINEAIMPAFEGISYDERFPKYLAIYMTLESAYRHFHWLSSGTASYADHLLFERLYNCLTEEVDCVAEKLVGLVSKECVCPLKTSRLIHENFSKVMPGFTVNCDPYDIIALSIYLEILFLEINNNFYKDLEENGMTLGLDDLITSNHGRHEKNLYLLKRRYESCQIK